MEKNQKKHAVKGMTLVEIIISVVVLGVASLILVQVGSAVNTYRKNSNHVSNRVTIEKPYVTHVTNGHYEPSKNNVEAPKEVKVKINFEDSGHDVELKAQSFKTKTNEASAKTVSDANLQFVKVDLSKGIKYQKDADGYYILKKGTETYYKKGGEYFDSTKTKIDLDALHLTAADFTPVMEDDGNVWIDIAPKTDEPKDSTSGETKE